MHYTQHSFPKKHLQKAQVNSAWSHVQLPPIQIRLTCFLTNQPPGSQQCALIGLNTARSRQADTHMGTVIVDANTSDLMQIYGTFIFGLRLLIM